MKRIITTAIVYAMIVLHITAIATAKQGSSPKTLTENELNEYSKKLLSDDFKERSDAVIFLNTLDKNLLSKEILNAAVEQFKKEMEPHKGVYKVKKGSQPLSTSQNHDDGGELYAIYQGNLCALASKSGDSTILPLLVQHCLNAKILSIYGDAAVQPIIDRLQKTDNPMGKASAIQVLGEMLKKQKEGYIASGEVRNQIKSVLMQKISDQDTPSRQMAVRALGDSGDEDVVPVLEDIAKHDQHVVIKKDDKGNMKREFYPIREEAQKSIKKIKEKKAEK